MWLCGGPCSREESWLVHASQPQSTHTFPCLVCHSVLIYNTREAPLFVTWWPKWPGPAEDASGASGCVRASRAHPPVPWSMPRARCPLTGLKLESFPVRDPRRRRKTPDFASSPATAVCQSLSTLRQQPNDSKPRVLLHHEIDTWQASFRLLSPQKQ